MTVSMLIKFVISVVVVYPICGNYTLMEDERRFIMNMEIGNAEFWEFHI